MRQPLKKRLRGAGHLWRGLQVPGGYQLGTVGTVPRACKRVYILNSFEIRRNKYNKNECNNKSSLDYICLYFAIVKYNLKIVFNGGREEPMETKICIASPECQRLDAILGTRLLPGCPEDPAQDGRQGHGTPSECDNASMLKSLPRSLGSSFATLALCAYPYGSSLVGAGFAHLRVFPLPDCQSRAGTGPGP